MGRPKGSKNKDKEIMDTNLSEPEEGMEEDGKDGEVLFNEVVTKIIQARTNGGLSRPKAVAMHCTDCNGGQKLSCMIPSCALFEFNKFKFTLPKGMPQEEIDSFKVELAKYGIKKATFKFKGGDKVEVETDDNDTPVSISSPEKPKKKRGVDWGSMTAEQRAAHIARMQAGRKKKVISA